MAGKLRSAPHLEIAHVLFIDVVGYSKLLVNEQRELVQELGQIVRKTRQFRRSQASGKLIRIPVGDGMALVFFRTPEEPVLCALEIAQLLKMKPNIQLRMGIHSGPIDHLRDVNNQANVAGTGINVAQRIMALGDAGHILLSERVALDLAQDRHWGRYLHPLGEVELKHGLKTHVINLYTGELGNAAAPAKIQNRGKSAPDISPSIFRLLRSRSGLLLGALLAAAGVAGAIVWQSRGPESPLLPPPIAPSAQKSIAVLPFDDLSEDRRGSSFGDALQGEILVDLAKIADLKVISRTSVMPYRTAAQRNLRVIAKELGVTHVVEGSVTRIEEHVRISAQLIDAATDSHIWAESYERDLKDLFALQSIIAKTIADQLHATITASERSAIDRTPTSDLTAYHFYSRAQTLWGIASDPARGGERLFEAARLLEQAVERDPKFLRAWCLLAKTRGAIYAQHDQTAQRLETAKAAAEKALQLDPGAGETHLALACYHYYCFRDYAAARRELALARPALPNDAELLQYSGLVDRRQGRWKEATQSLERALELDPLNLFIIQQLALTYIPQRRYEDEARTWDRLLTITPSDPLTRISRALVELNARADVKPYLRTRDELLQAALTSARDFDSPIYALCERNADAMARALASYPDEGMLLDGILYPRSYWEGAALLAAADHAGAEGAFTGARAKVARIVEQQPDSPAALSLLGIIDAGLGRRNEAIQEARHACELLPISEDAIDGASLAVNLAQVYAWSGETELAIAQLQMLTRIPNDLSYGMLELCPYWDSLRGDTRFRAIVAALAPKK